MQYIIARTFSGRPSLMHSIGDFTNRTTSCGVDFSRWSRAYFDKPISQVLCKRCGRNS